MTKKEINKIARAIAQSEIAANLDNRQSQEVRSTIMVALWQLDNSFDFTEFENKIVSVHTETYEEYMADQYK